MVTLGTGTRHRVNDSFLFSLYPSTFLDLISNVIRRFRRGGTLERARQSGRLLAGHSHRLRPVDICRVSSCSPRRHECVARLVFPIYVLSNAPFGALKAARIVRRPNLCSVNDASAQVSQA